jgi:hypothetical protein
MEKIMNNFEKIKDNWEKFESLCRRLSDNNLNNLLDSVGERILMCPASTRTDQYGCYPGGLVDHSLKVTAAMRRLNDAYDLDLTAPSIASILKAGLLHDIGKIGDLEKDNFIEQDSDWHRDKLGQLYKFNEDLHRMSVSHRTLYILQNFGVTLTSDEWLSIQLAQGSHFEENRFYVGHEPTLAIILQQAKSFVIHREK